MVLSSFFEGWLGQLSLVIVTLITALYIYSIYCYNYWKNKGIPCIDGKFPFGSIADIILFRKGFNEFNEYIYKRFEGNKYAGIYTFFEPQFVVRDLDLIKNIIVKDFNNFVDRGGFIDEENDPMTGNLFSMEGTRWKNLRAKLSPTFTSSKMKIMFHTMSEISKDLQEYGSKKMISEGGVVNVKDMISRYGLDVITSVAMGLNGNNFVEDKTELKKMTDLVISPTPRQMINALLFSFANKNLLRFLKIRITERVVENYFLNMIEETVNYRLKNNVKRNDFMQILIELYEAQNNNGEVGTTDRKENKVTLTIKEMAAQAFVFVLAGFETTSSTLSFLTYEIALNRDIQDQLIAELDGLGPNPTYDGIQSLRYTEMVINETLRKYPVVSVLQRQCLNDYELPGGEVLDRGTRIMIPIIGLQKDPEYFQDPEKFDPERFNEENIKNILPFSYLPFGEGPRVCIGMRFAKMQIKLALYGILSRFEITTCDKTQIPLEIEKNSFTLNAKGGMYLRLTERKK